MDKHEWDTDSGDHCCARRFGEGYDFSVTDQHIEGAEEAAAEILRLAEENRELRLRANETRVAFWDKAQADERARIRRELEEWLIGDFPREDAGLYNSRRIVNEIERICAGAVTSCVWREDPDGNRHTDCGHIFCFDDDGPAKNGFRFCCYCGSGLKEEPHREAEEVE